MIPSSSATALIALAIGLTSVAGTAQEAPSIFAQLHGEWVGTGTLMDRAARFTMRWDATDRFATLAFSNAFVDSAGQATTALSAVAVYRTSPQHSDGVWLDSRNFRIEIRWEATDSSLVANWAAPTESGRTTYTYRSQDEVMVLDEVMTRSGPRIFAQARYRRR